MRCDQLQTYEAILIDLENTPIETTDQMIVFLIYSDLIEEWERTGQRTLH